MTALLEMTNITKRFASGVLANDGIDFNVNAGEVHALLGENGAGKTTLVNILYGLLPPTDGRIVFSGRPVRITSPRDALDLGIGMVHQHFMLIPALTVAENVILGMPQCRKPVLNLQKIARQVGDLSEHYGMRLDPLARVWQLSVGEQQRVEIVKALFRGAGLLILDEPTSVLTPQETDVLFQIVRRLTAEGQSVIFITHKLNEVMEIADRVTVLREGKAVGGVRTSETRPLDLAKMMVGREVLFRIERAPSDPGRRVLEMQSVRATNRRGLVALNDVSLDVRAGEIVGIAGVDGNGQAELVEAAAGLLRITSGRVLVNGKDLTNAHPRQVYEAGVSHIPGDKRASGLVMGMNLSENLILQTYYRTPFRKGLFLDWKSIRAHGRDLIRQYQVRTTGDMAPVEHLSGGNQQKVVLARELSRQPALLLAVYPTRGLDIGATEFVRQQIVAARDRGCAVLLVSNELDEILSLSDRVAVMFEGEIAGVIESSEANAQDLGLMMAGSKSRAG